MSMNSVCWGHQEVGPDPGQSAAMRAKSKVVTSQWSGMMATRKVAVDRNEKNSDSALY